jgi:hypothetical protein
MRAIGFHGTSVEAAQRILSAGFEISRNEYDWLGDGAYFFQDAPARATEWARQRFGADAAVIGAEIDLDGCVDMLDIPWERVLVRAFESYAAYLAQIGRPVPRQTPGAHRLDRGVINYLAEGMDADGMHVRSIRAVFPEGEPMYPGSALLSRAHVQIAVRDCAVIRGTWLHEREAGHAGS